MNELGPCKECTSCLECAKADPTLVYAPIEEYVTRHPATKDPHGYIQGLKFVGGFVLVVIAAATIIGIFYGIASLAKAVTGG